MCAFPKRIFFALNCYFERIVFSWENSDKILQCCLELCMLFPFPTNSWTLSFLNVYLKPRCIILNCICLFSFCLFFLFFEAIEKVSNICLIFYIVMHFESISMDVFFFFFLSNAWQVSICGSLYRFPFRCFRLYAD